MICDASMAACIIAHAHAPTNARSFPVLDAQVFYNKNVVNKMRAMEGWRNKLSAVVKGPSWLPGRPWTGADEDKIDVSTHSVE